MYIAGLFLFVIVVIIAFFIHSFTNAKELIALDSIKVYVESSEKIYIESKLQGNLIVKTCKKYNYKRVRSSDFNNTGLIDINLVRDKLIIK